MSAYKRSSYIDKMIKGKGKSKEKEKSTNNEDEVDLNLEQLRQFIKAEEKERILQAKKEPISEDFIYTVKMCGSGCHVLLPRRWLGRKIRIKIEDVITTATTTTATKTKTREQ